MSDCKTIYIDLDDVLCQTARHFLVLVEREFGKIIEYEKLIDFDVGRSCGLSESERTELYRIVHRQDELLRIAPVTEAIVVLEHWAKQDFKIAVVTGRPPESADVSLAWLARHRIAYSSFTVVDKYARFTPDNKSAISLADLARRRYCWAVEDSLPTALFLAAQMKVPVALIDRPWNQSADRQPGIERFRDWQAIAASALTRAASRTSLP